jgi:hypothetical protein
MYGHLHSGWCRDIQHNDTQQNNTHRNGAQYNKRMQHLTKLDQYNYAECL